MRKFPGDCCQNMNIDVVIVLQSFSCVWLFETPWTAAHQAFLSITNSRSSLKLKSIKSVMPSNHLILCCPLLLLPSVFPSIRVFSSESVLHMRWSKYWHFGFSISPSNDRKHIYKCHDMSLCKFIRKTPFPGSLPWIPCLGWLGKLFMNKEELIFKNKTFWGFNTFTWLSHEVRGEWH